MMRVEAEELERAFEEREAKRAPVLGVEFVRAQGVQGLKEAGVLQGVRAMSARVYAGEDWYVHDEGGTGRIECLYERARKGACAVQYVVARLTDEDRWARDGRQPEGSDDDEGGRRPEGDGGEAAGQGWATASEDAGGEGGSGGAGLGDEGGDGRGGDVGEDGRERGDSGASGGVGLGADGGDLAGAAGGATGGGECSVEAGGGKGVGDDRGGVSGGGGKEGRGGRDEGEGEEGGGEGDDDTGGGCGGGSGGGGTSAGGPRDVGGADDGGERAGVGRQTSVRKRSREGEAADRTGGRKVRTRTEPKGGRKRKKGDG